MEAHLEVASRELGTDPVELRQRNLIQSTVLPYRTPLGRSTTVAISPEICNLRSSIPTMPDTRRGAPCPKPPANCEVSRSSMQSSRQRAQSPEFAEVRFTQWQCHAAAWAPSLTVRAMKRLFKQVLHDKLTRSCGGSVHPWAHRSRGLRHGLQRFTVNGCRRLGAGPRRREAIEKGKLIAAQRTEVGVADVSFADCKFSVAGTDWSLTLKQVAMA